MKNKILRILSTRPLDESLVQKAAESNIVIDQITFIEIKKLIDDETLATINILAKQPAVVAFTSMNAVEVLIESLPEKSNIPDWKIYCMGGATFGFVKKFWPYENILNTAKNASELAQKIISDHQPEVHFFCGNKRREELPALLREHNISVNELMIYETIETTEKLEKEYDALLFFSPSAVHSFFQKNTVADSTIFFAIGDTSAAAIRQFCSNKIVVGDFPAKDQLVDKAIEYFKDAAIGD